MTDYGDAFNAAVAEVLRLERVMKRITIAELAERSGLGVNSVKRYLDGERPIPLPAFRNLCGALGVDPLVIIERGEQAAIDG